MGWNEVLASKTNNNVFLFEENNYYFVHSYYFDCKDKKNILAYTKYGIKFASFVFQQNIFGVQFHPEKSSKQGLDLIKSFIKL